MTGTTTTRRPDLLMTSYNDDEFDQLYRLGKQIGSGSFALVHQGQHRHTRQACAIKIVQTSQLNRDQQSHLREEIQILSSLSYHPNIISLQDVFFERRTPDDDDDDCCRTYLVTELVRGGELFDRIIDRDCYSESNAQQVCVNLLSALEHLHSKNICHRDIKPENILLTSRQSDTNVKLADFGFATYCDEPEASLRTVCGTPGYKAPELYKKQPYGLAVDCWSLGVVVYVMLGGYAPFEEDNDGPVSVKQICGGIYEFHDEFWGHVSDRAMDLIQGLMTVDPRQRLTVHQALEHEWITTPTNGCGSLIEEEDAALVKSVGEPPMVTWVYDARGTDERALETVKHIPTPAAA